MESKTGKNVFCMRSEKIFLRVRVWFVQCRDALMQILARLDRDKNSSVGTAVALVASEKRLTVGLCFLFCLLRRLPIRLASEMRIMVGLVLFLKRLTVGLFVKKTTNWAWEETYGRTCFIFLLLFSWPTLGLKKKKNSASLTLALIARKLCEMLKKGNMNILQCSPDIGIMVRVFAIGLWELGSIPGRVIPKTQKMVFDAILLNTQHYKVRIKGKVEQSRERSSALPYTLV